MHVLKRCARVETSCTCSVLEHSVRVETLRVNLVQLILRGITIAVEAMHGWLIFAAFCTTGFGSV